MRTAVLCAILLQLTLVASHEIFRRASNLTFEQVGAILQTLTAELNRTEVKVDSINHRLTVLEFLGSNCSEKFAFRSDFGKQPYSEVYVGPNGVVKFNRVQLNLGDGYNLSTGIFTATVNGTFIFGVQIMTTNTGPPAEYGIVVNSTVLAAIAQASGYDTVNDKGFAIAVVQLKPGDTVSVRHQYGAYYLWGSTLTSFFGFRALC